MSLVLAEVEDGVTAVDELSVNQYKTAIETLAGAGWDDSAGDLDVEELSDAVKTPGDGLDYSGGNLVVDASDFAGTGLEDDGANNLRIAAAAAGDGLQGGAGSALAVDVSDFAGTGLEDDGSENLRIADGGVSVAKMADSALSGRGNTAARPANAKAGYLYHDTQTAQLLRDTGAAWEEVTGTLSATNVTDLTDGGATTLHCHAARYCLWSHAVVQASANSDAAALTVLSKTDANTRPVIIARVSLYKTPEIDSLVCRFTYNAATGGTAPRLKLQDSLATSSATASLTADSTDHYVELALDISGWTDDAGHEVNVNIWWNTAGGGAHDLQIKHLSLWAEPATAPA